jgi:release factor glutamine methyltransferase
MRIIKSNFFDVLKNIYSIDEINALFKICISYIKGYQNYRLTLLDETLNDTEIAKLNEIIIELVKKRPIQYIIGQSYFGDHLIYVNESVLIPRPETEELCLICNRIIELKHYKSMLDIGTGSGCISIYLKSKNKSLAVTALDISKKAIDIANKNAKENNTEITFLECDILNIPSIKAEFDLIISNPPYIGISEIESIDSNVKDYEPHLALFVPDGDELIFYRRIIAVSKTCLNINGSIAFECNQKYCNEVSSLLTEASFENVTILKDFYNNPRFVIGTKCK